MVLKRNPLQLENSQANSIIERVHQTIGQIIRTMEPQNTDNIDNPFKGILSAICFAIRATVHTTLQATPSQLVFGRDHLLNIKYEANLKQICKQKQRLINKNNKLENNKRKEYKYVVGQKVPIKTEQSRKFGKVPYKGPFEITAINNNGSARLRSLLGQGGSVEQTYNIRNMISYSE